MHVAYGIVEVLHGVDVTVVPGAVVSILGSNGAGKSTLLNTISGLVKAKSGRVTYLGRQLPAKPHLVVRSGIVQVPEGRKIFGGLSVLENLILGAYTSRDAEDEKVDTQRMFDMFPRLQERQSQQAGTLSGGEQQMLAVARALMAKPRIIMMDEPSLGLSPLMIKEIFKIITSIHKMGIMVLLVEQNAKKALSVCDYAYVLENGRIVMEGEGKKLADDARIKKAYLGG
ncbi:MAG: ABC transporter ATP-binding protein [Synergistaceae bacterium]|nr:ABC transporter ATP-binding protein [Synergistaceae bacterium]